MHLLRLLALVLLLIPTAAMATNVSGTLQQHDVDTGGQPLGVDG